MKSNLPPNVWLISDQPIHIVLFKHKLRERFHVLSFSARDFDLSKVDHLPCQFIVIHDSFQKNGLHLLIREFRKRTKFFDIPILIISSSLKKSYIDQLIRAGATDFLQEPIEEEDIEMIFRDTEKYRSMQQKMDRIAGNLSSTEEQAKPFKARFLMNRVAFQEIESAVSKRMPLSVLLVEISPSSQIAETTEQKLIHFFSSPLDSSDYLIHLGHGKFVICLQKKSAKEVFFIAKRLISEVSLKEFFIESNLAVSIGMTTNEKLSYNNVASMLRDAKGALQKAKQVGNQVVLFSA